jgi:hypothetical protein
VELITQVSNLLDIIPRFTCGFALHLFTSKKQMNSITAALTALFNRIPRRHSADNIKDINGIVSEYEDLLITIEAVNSFYEKSIPVFFDEVEMVKATIKRSNDNKASKKNKDSLFDEASGILKDSIQSLIALYADGKRTV